MNKLDPHSLFQIFEQGDEEIYKQHDVVGVLDNPYVLIGMVVTGVENFQLIDGMYLARYEEHYSRVRGKIKYRYYTKLYSYLTRMESIRNIDAYTIGDSFEVDRSINSFIDLQFYFQSIEQYDKCQVIKQYSDLLINNKLQELI